MTDENEHEYRQEQQRLWTPWRMKYVAAAAAEGGCLFCNRLAADDDVASLIVHRGERAFVMMNLFPYNTGHLMIVPVEHVASPEAADPHSLRAMSDLLPPVLRALRRVLNADGFNTGLNIGSVAGAGVAVHMHQHVVPRWQGDANFMPILASTMVMPELIPVTYAKIRAELQREFGGDSARKQPTSVILLSPGSETIMLIEESGRVSLPSVRAAADEPIWRAATDWLRLGGWEADLVGWAGDARASSTGPIAMAFVTGHDYLEGSIGKMIPLEEARGRLGAHQRMLLDMAMMRLGEQ